MHVWATTIWPALKRSIESTAIVLGALALALGIVSVVYAFGRWMSSLLSEREQREPKPWPRAVQITLIILAFIASLPLVLLNAGHGRLVRHRMVRHSD
jgi:uncharacterized membrane protein HdeD (DUF308 family)